MKRTTLWIAVIMILFFVPVLPAAEQNRQNNQKIPAEVKKPAVPLNVEANESSKAGLPQQPTPRQIQELRQRSRDRIHQRAIERRRRVMDGNGLPRDVNVNRPRRDVNEAMLKERAARRQLSESELRQRQMRVVDKQLTIEETKHRERFARLTRIRELSQQQGDAEATARVDRLLKKENKMYEMVMQRIKLRKEKITGSESRQAPVKDKKQPASPAKRGEPGERGL
ncbi:MAG: hypothetical protein JW749_05700 [Sedimentisphaerales bacterium]|nr:hypothetical protein [Sedimentisphaerales bacterium]